MNPPSDQDTTRINRFLARAGLGSRRAVEDLIRQGRVTVNGDKITDLGRRVDPVNDVVTVDGHTATWPDTWRIFAFHKPVGVVSSLRPQGRTPCLDLYAGQADLPSGTVPVGRLDADTSGLLIWTDDGALHQALCRPRSGVWKVYVVDLNRPLPPDAESKLSNGEILLDGRPCLKARLRRRDDDGRRWEIAVSEGRNRQVRRMFMMVGVRVIGLHRIAVGDLQLADLRPGEFRELDTAESAALRSAAGV